MLGFRYLNYTTITCLSNLEFSKFLSWTLCNSSLFFLCLYVYIFYFFLKKPSHFTGTKIYEVIRSWHPQKFQKFWFSPFPSTIMQFWCISPPYDVWIPPPEKKCFGIFPPKTLKGCRQKRLGQFCRFWHLGWGVGRKKPLKICRWKCGSFLLDFYLIGQLQVTNIFTVINLKQFFAKVVVILL